MSKTYVPTLRLVLGQAYRYVTRYQTQLSLALTAPQLECLAAVVSALASCLSLLGANPVED
jgi:hypothetical protein